MYLRSDKLRERTKDSGLLLRRLECTGVHPSHDARSAKRVILANRLTLFYFLIAWPCYFAFRRVGADILAWAVFPMLAWHALTFAMNAKGWAKLERDLIAAREKAQEADRLKSRFIANMSHEVRTPLNVISGLAQIMEYPDSESKRNEFLANIRAASKDLLAILNDVFDLSKIEAGQMKLESMPFRIHDLAEMALVPFRPQAGHMGLKLLLDADAGDPGLLRGDLPKLRQILNSLLSNAVKFTSKGTVVLRIRRAGGDERRPWIRFEVADTGIGIAPDAQRELFQPFQQADNGMTRTFGGSGLGLVLCKSLVELMGGTIRLSSRLGAGTTVEFALPFDVMAGTGMPVSETDDGDASHPERKRSEGKAANPRILIVEDHPVNRMILQDMLHVQGFRVDEAIDGKRALEAISAEPYDLILMDCHMPVMDGIECTRRIRAMGGGRPTIIGITADASIETRENCLSAGMDQVLLKPLEEKDLLKALLPWQPTVKTEPPIFAASEVSEWVDIIRLNRLIQETRLHDLVYRKKAFEQFEADVQALRQELSEAAKIGKAEQLKDSAHGLKGLCRTLGLNRLADACKHIETLSLSAGSPDWSPVLTDLETAFDASLVDLRRVMKV
jgi:signal transduction histidine kinase/CheY-like chemotaxis protein/HPt (histidine-containing phosphotransfer) domain-containing protein